MSASHKIFIEGILSAINYTEEFQSLAEQFHNSLVIIYFMTSVV